MSRCNRFRQALGFTLLEVMVAMTVLGSALVVIVQAQTRSVAASLHAQQMTIAQFLARAALTRLEEDLEANGFPALEEVRDGDFSSDGHGDFRYTLRIEKVELPGNMADMAQKTATAKQADALSAGGVKAPAGGPTTSSTSGAAQAVFSQFEMIRSALEQSVRKVTARVFWTESGREQQLEIATFYTDPSKVDASLPGLGALPMGGGLNQPGQPTPNPRGQVPGQGQGQGTTPQPPGGIR